MLYRILKRIDEAFARVKLDSLFSGDLDGLSGFGIPAFPGLSCFDFEASKAREGHSVSLLQPRADSADQRSQGFFCLKPGDSGVFGHSGC